MRTHNDSHAGFRAPDPSSRFVMMEQMIRIMGPYLCIIWTEARREARSDMDEYDRVSEATKELFY